MKVPRARTIVFSLCVCLIVCVFTLYMGMEYRQRKNELISIRLALLSSRLDATVANLSDFSRFVYETSVSRDEVTALMNRAWKASLSERSALRNELRAMMADEYELLTRFNFRQLHFHFPDTTSFLRMHSPLVFGDALGDVRLSIKKANTELVPVDGFEEGRIYNGFRFVYPLFYQGEHTGSVEVSFSMKNVLDILAEVSAGDLQFIISRSVVEDVVFSDQLDHYRESSFSSDFMYDGAVLPGEANRALLDSLDPSFTARLAAWADFGIDTRFYGSDYLVLCKAIHNVKGDPVAWIIMSERTTALEHIRSDLVFMCVSVLLSLILLISFSILIRRDRLRLKTLSLTDSLTGIANRVSLFDFLSREINKSVRYGFDLSLILFDIDHFKQINDSYGHAEGDRVLVKTVEAVRSEIRSSDFLARLGGEEFVVILSHCPVEAAITAAEKIRRAVAQAKVYESSPVTISVGVASLQKEERADSLIARADQAMYRAKEAGRNCVRVSP